jgi:hypothetical protein
MMFIYRKFLLQSNNSNHREDGGRKQKLKLLNRQEALILKYSVLDGDYTLHSDLWQLSVLWLWLFSMQTPFRWAFQWVCSMPHGTVWLTYHV